MNIKFQKIEPIFLLITLIIQGFILKIEFFNNISLIGFLDEVVALYCFLYCIINFKDIAKNSLILSAFFIYLTYVIISLVSSVVAEVYYFQFIFQFILDLKFLAVILYCAIQPVTQFNIQRLEKTFIFIILINIPFVFWQFAGSSSYDFVFATSQHLALLYTSWGGEYARAVGVFWHPGIMGMFMALASGYFYLKIFIHKNYNRSNLLFLVLSLAQLSITFSRGEIGAFFISAFIVTVMLNVNVLVRFFGFISASTFLIGLLLISPKFLESSFQEMGFGDLTWETAPRALLMHASQDIAKENFPFGGGLGTFGGLSADVFDSNLYYKYNLSREWWFNERLFLRDTYWPKIIGESGFIGAIILFIFILYPVLVNYRRRFCISQSYSIFGLFVLFIISLSSPAYNAPLYVLCGYLLSSSLYRVR